MELSLRNSLQNLDRDIQVGKPENKFDESRKVENKFEVSLKNLLQVVKKAGKTRPFHEFPSECAQDKLKR